MGKYLYTIWLEEEVGDLVDYKLRYGLFGLLEQFELWLEKNKYLVDVCRTGSVGLEGGEEIEEAEK